MNGDYVKRGSSSTELLRYCRRNLMPILDEIYIKLDNAERDKISEHDREILKIYNKLQEIDEAAQVALYPDEEISRTRMLFRDDNSIRYVLL